MHSLVTRQLQKAIGPDFAQKRYVIAVSGGVDSMVLWSVIRTLLPCDHFVVAHYNHRIRGKASDQDAKFVGDRANRYKNLSAIGRGKVARHHKSEEKLRNERLKFLKDTATLFECDFILTAHHLDDQWETILMRLIRGTGITGLKGIELRRGPWVRPLLESTRDDISLFAKTNRISFCVDKTNQDTKYFRNEIRHRILPPLYQAAEQYGGKKAFLKRVSLLSQEISEASASLERRARISFSKGVVTTPLWTRLKTRPFLKLSKDTQRRVVRMVLSQMKIATLSRAKTNEVCQKLSEGKRFEVPGSLQVTLSCGYAFFQKPHQRTEMLEDLSLVRTKLSCPSLGISAKLSPELARRVTPRFFSPGDKQGSTKLKRLFLENRIPLPERKVLPLLVDKRTGEAVWFYPQQSPDITVERVTFPFSFLTQKSAPR